MSWSKEAEGNKRDGIESIISQPRQPYKLRSRTVLSTADCELSYLVFVLENLKLHDDYDGMVFLAESTRHTPRLHSHHHVELELNLVVQGTVTYVVGERRFTFPARTLVWLFPEQEHQLIDASDDSKNYVMVFKPSLIRRACRTKAYAGLLSNNTDMDRVLNTVLEPESFDLIRKTMDSLMQESLDPDLLNRESGFGFSSTFTFTHGDPDGLNAGLHHLLLLCWRSQRNGSILGDAVPLHPAVRKAIKLLSDRRKVVDLKSLARECKLSEAHLSRMFHRQMGIPITRYRNSLRLSRFWENFKQEEPKTLMEAAYEAGFGSYAQFYKVFTQTYGDGPRVARTRKPEWDLSIRSLA